MSSPGPARSEKASPITDAIVEFVSRAELGAADPAAVDRARTALLDTLAVAIAGSAHEPAVRLREAVVPPASAGGATVIGSKQPAPVLDAVLANGYAAHALDYDDTLQGLTTHPSCHLVPALLGVAEAITPEVGVSELMLAYLVGLEVEARLASALNPGHARRGWHTTGTLGTIATAAAVARLLRFTPEEVRTAIAIACSSASGLRANFGTMVKPLHAARAARAGVESALLVRAGFDAVRNPIEHEFGFLNAYGANSAAAEDPGWDPNAMRECRAALRLTFKPYPCCGEATALVEAALRARERVAPDDVSSIEILVTPFAREILEFDQPSNGDQARFSGTFCVAASLRFGRLGIGDFAPDALADPGVQALLERTRVVVDDTLAGHGGGVALTTPGGRIAERVDVPKGHASIGMPAADAAAKFNQCAEPVLGRARAAELQARVAEALHGGADLGWIALLSRPQDQARREEVAR